MKIPPVLLEGLPFDVSGPAASRGLNLPADSPDIKEFFRMLADARRAGSPRAVFRESSPSEISEENIVIEGESFRSRVLAVNLRGARRIFLYAATCGGELEEWSSGYSDPLHSYFAEFIKGAALEGARKQLFSFIRESFGIREHSAMAPGSLDDWPVEQQAPLFRALGGGPRLAGIRLSESFMMTPSKSVSGILFPAESHFSSCMLCPRGKCPGRGASYDGTLYEKKYGGSTS